MGNKKLAWKKTFGGIPMFRRLQIELQSNCNKTPLK
jgi:hypothetical protein